MKVRNRKRIAAYAWLVLLLLCGAAVRIAGAWWQRHTHNPDFGIVALMAKHMAEWRDFPVFFYGQAYMGSLEPMVSAIFCRVMGFSGFAVCLGTAFVGFLLLPLLFRVGREAGGVKAGLIAVCYCAIGPGGYFHYQISSRGGYPLTLLFATLILWMTVNIIFRERNGLADSGWRWLLLGLTAGAGWWTNQLITPAIATAAVLFIVMLGRKVFTWKLAPGLLGFIIGSLPLWIWNANNGWGTFAFLESLGTNEPGAGLRIFINERLPAILDFGSGHRSYRIAAGAIIASGSALALVRFAMDLWRKGLTRANLHLAAAFLYVIILAASFCSSHFAKLNTPRYLMPIVPVVALLLGVAVARHPKAMVALTIAVFAYAGAWLLLNLPDLNAWRIPALCVFVLCMAAGFCAVLRMRNLAAVRAMVTLPVAFLLVWQAGNLRDFRERGRAYDEWAASCGAGFRQDLRRIGARAIYTVYNDHALNYLFREEFCFSDMKGERFSPYADFAEEQDSVAVLNNYGHVDMLLAAAGGTSKVSNTDRPYVVHDLRPPEIGKAEIPRSEWESATDITGNVGLEYISDRNAGTRWKTRSDGTTLSRNWIEVKFRQPERIAGVRINSDRNRYPTTWQVEGWPVGGKGWRELTPQMWQVGYYWSGPRIYYGGRMYRQECVCESVPVERLRIRLAREGQRGDMEVSELQVFRCADYSGGETNEVGGLVEAVSKAELKYLYCDRWIGNAVRKATRNAVETPREIEIRRVRTGDAEMWMSLNGLTGVLARREDAAVSRDAMAACGIKPLEQSVGPWTLFTFDDANLSASRVGAVLKWTGYGCLIGSPKRYANSLMLRAADCLAANDPDKALALNRESLRICPDFGPALDQLAALYRKNGDSNAFEECEQRIQSARRGKTTVQALFGDKIRLVDSEVSAGKVAAGDVFELRLFWKIPPFMKLNDYVVFVHFISEGRIGFQGDHALTDDVEDVDYQPVEEVFTGRKKITVPKDARSGVYNVVIGIYNPARGEQRLRVRTDLPNENNAVTLPVRVNVGP